MSKLPKLALSLAVVIGLITPSAIAQTKSPCQTNAYGRKICPPAGGEIYESIIPGKFVCGKGQCEKDIYNRLMCATESGGYATKNAFGKVECSGGCEQASEGLCRSPQ